MELESTYELSLHRVTICCLSPRPTSEYEKESRGETQLRMVALNGNDPFYRPYESHVLPLNYSAIFGPHDGIRIHTTCRLKTVALPVCSRGEDGGEDGNRTHLVLIKSQGPFHIGVFPMYKLRCFSNPEL